MFSHYFALKHYFLRKIYLGFLIPKDSFVLDLGSGDKPFWRADVFIDDVIMDNSQRAGNIPVTKVGIFVDANANNLPFDDETFDFVYCSHLLEHVENPNIVINEILRVTKSSGGGYIECPSGIADLIDPFHGHLWLIFNPKDTELKFIRQSNALHNAARENIRIRNKLLKHFFWNGYLLFIEFLWSKKEGLNYSISDNLIEKDKYIACQKINYLDNTVNNSSKFSFRIFLIKVIRKLYLKSNDLKTNFILSKFHSYKYDPPIKTKISTTYLRKN